MANLQIRDIASFKLFTWSLSKLIVYKNAKSNMYKNTARYYVSGCNDRNE